MNFKKIMASFLFMATYLTYSQEKDCLLTAYSGHESFLGTAYGVDCRNYLKGGLYSFFKLQRSYFHDKYSLTGTSSKGKTINYNMDESRKLRLISLGFGYDYSFKEKHSIFLQGTLGVVHAEKIRHNEVGNDYKYLPSEDGRFLEHKHNSALDKTGHSETLSLGYDYNIYSDFFIGSSFIYYNRFTTSDPSPLFNFRLSYLIR